MKKTVGTQIDYLLLGQSKINTLNESVTFEPDVKKDPNTANISGQAQHDSDEDSQALKTGDVELEDIIDKLNAIRAGRSVKDDEIRNELESYFTELTSEERIALFAYLKGMAQVVSGEFAGENAIEPGDTPASITMLRARYGHKKVNPNVVVKGKHGGGDEDTTPPSPITPKSR